MALTPGVEPRPHRWEGECFQTVLSGLFHGLLRRYANVITNVRASQNGLQHFCRYGAQLASVRLVTFDITFGARFLPSFTLNRAPVSYTSGKR